MFKKTSKIYLTTIILTVLIVITAGFIIQIKTVVAATTENNKTLLNEQTGILGTIGKEAKYIGDEKEADISATDARRNLAIKIGNILGAFLAGMGVIFLCYMVYSGYQWMSSGGEEEKVTKARTRIINTTIGLAIIAVSYGVTNVVLQVLNYNSNKSLTPTTDVELVGLPPNQSCIGQPPPARVNGKNTIGEFWCTELYKCQKVGIHQPTRDLGCSKAVGVLPGIEKGMICCIEVKQD